MGKIYTPTPVGSGFNVANINSNFNDIESALESYLARTGETPNAMAADLDMNSNDILNVASLTASALTVNGTDVVALVNQANTSATNAANSAAAAATSATNAAAAQTAAEAARDDAIAAIEDQTDPRYWGAVWGTTVDQSAALQAWINGAQGEFLDGHGGTFAVSNKLFLSGQHRNMRNIRFHVIAGGNLTDSEPLLTMNSLHQTVENAWFELNGICCGIRARWFAQSVHNVRIFGPANTVNGYGIKQEAGRFSGINLTLAGFPSTTVDSAKNVARFNKGIWLSAADFKLIDVTSWQHLWQGYFDSGTNTGMCTTCHWWDSDPDGALALNTIYIGDTATNHTFTANYFDSGKATIRNLRNTFIGSKLLNAASNTTSTAMFMFDATSVGQTFSEFQYIGGNHINSLSVPVFEFNESGGNTWNLSGFARGLIEAYNGRGILGEINHIWSPENAFPIGLIEQAKFEPIDQSNVNGPAIFVRPSDGKLIFKDGSGVTHPLY